jgi:hypothetical protein
VRKTANDVLAPHELEVVKVSIHNQHLIQPETNTLLGCIFGIPLCRYYEHGKSDRKSETTRLMNEIQCLLTRFVSHPQFSSYLGDLLYISVSSPIYGPIRSMTDRKSLAG